MKTFDRIKTLDPAAKKLLTNLGLNVAGARKALGFTQRELASKARIGYRYLQAIEAGEVNATLSTISKVAIALTASASELLGDRN